MMLWSAPNATLEPRIPKSVVAAELRVGITRAEQ
jgi:hypothetical protein